jgi:hypothetical protein
MGKSSLPKECVAESCYLPVSRTNGGLVLAGSKQITLSEDARGRVSGFRNGWSTYATKY